MYGLRVYPGIHLFIGRCYDFFFLPVMNRISLEAYPLLPFISPSLSLSLPPFPPSVYLPLPPSKSQIEILYFFFRAPLLLSCCCSLSVSMMWKRLNVIPFLANPPHYVTLTLFYICHSWNNRGVCIWGSPSASS